MMVKLTFPFASVYVFWPSIGDDAELPGFAPVSEEVSLQKSLHTA